VEACQLLLAGRDTLNQYGDLVGDGGHGCPKDHCGLRIPV
jgi:hypothetical protein